jgi:hypothetical protein
MANTPPTDSTQEGILLGLTYSHLIVIVSVYGLVVSCDIVITKKKGII